MNNYLLYTHNEPSEHTVGIFFKKSKIFLNDNKTNVRDFLLFSDENSVKNIEKIYQNYNELQKQIYRSTYSSVLNNSALPNEYFESFEVSNLPLNTGTVLFIPKVNFEYELISVAGKNLFLEQEDNFNYLWSKKLYQLTTSDGYVRSEKLSLGQGLDYNIEFINQNIQIWVWVRALNKIINLSPFVISCYTSKTDIGTFSISLNPIKNIDRLSYDLDNSILEYFNLDENGVSNLDFIHRNVQMNDIVFIRFEKLQLEDKNDNKKVLNNFEFEVGKDSLPGRVWDMIGLVDNCSQRSNLSAENYEVSISGRDLMKLLVEDASYWIPLYYLEGELSIVKLNYNPEDKFFLRNFVTGSFAGTNNTPSPYTLTTGRRSIHDTIGFIVNQLSNLGVTGDVDLFENYRDRRTRAYRITGTDQSQVTTNEVQGIWQIIKVFYDKILERRRVVDESLGRVDGTILDQFNKVCQQPFVEFYGDTYGDEFNLIVRQPPFTKGAIRSFIEGVKYHPSMEQDKLDSEKELTTKLFEIIDLDLSDIQGYDNLAWDNTYYTSYSITPRDEMLGQFQNIQFGGMVPILYIEEIAKIFGNRRLVINNNYISLPISGSEKEDDNSFRTAILNDLKYLIDINFYLPFTRRGTITIAKGDRRIRKGTFIRIKPTNEIFYVDGVSNSINFGSNRVDRTTNIQVSRGMIQDYIFGHVGFNEDGSIISTNKGLPIKFSYFDILKINLSKKSSKKIVSSPKTIINKSVNKGKYSVEIGVKGSPADRNNNPGNLIYANQLSATRGEVKSIYFNKETSKTETTYWARFETPEKGFNELIRQLELYSGREETNSIEKAINKYAPSSDNNNTEEYIVFVCRQLNKSRYTHLNSVNKVEMAKAIARKESQTRIIEIEEYEEIKEEVKEQDTDKVIETIETNLTWNLDKDQFDFFLKRKQFNINKFKQSASGN